MRCCAERGVATRRLEVACRDVCTERAIATLGDVDCENAVCRCGRARDRPGVRAQLDCALCRLQRCHRIVRASTPSLCSRAGERPAPVRWPCPFKRLEPGGTCPGRCRGRRVAPSGASPCATEGVETRSRLRHRESAEESWGTIGFAVSAMAQGSAVISGKSRTCGRR